MARPGVRPRTRSRQSRTQWSLAKVVKENLGIAVIRGSIDICDTDVQVRKFRGKHSGERVLSNNIGLQ